MLSNRYRVRRPLKRVIYSRVAGEFPRSLRAVDRASGDAVLLKAYALNEGENAAAWRDHEVEIDALLTLPRHEAIAAPRSIVSPIWAPVVSIDESSFPESSQFLCIFRTYFVRRSESPSFELVRRTVEDTTVDMLVGNEFEIRNE